jgi:RNA polymerase sigma-70 factor (ECF subfamily)
MPANLHDIIANVRNGDQRAFRTLVEMYQQPAYRLAFRILGNEEEARDAVQECFIRIWQKIGTFDSAREFIPWMYRILTNAATDRLRTMQRHATIPIEVVAKRVIGLLQGDRETPLENRDLAMLIRTLAGTLPEKQKLVFILRDVEGMSSEEVEAITGMSPDAVKSNLYLARRCVRERLFRIFEKERRTK